MTPNFEQTLTNLEAIREQFRLADPEPDPVTGPTRLAVEIDGAVYAETDVRTGETIRIGNIEREIARLKGGAP